MTFSFEESSLEVAGRDCWWVSRAGGDGMGVVEAVDAVSSTEKLLSDVVLL